MFKSFFLNESGFVAPWTALSWSWVAGILAGAATLFGTVAPALAEDCNGSCAGVPLTWDCADDCGGIKCTIHSDGSIEMEGLCS